MIFEKVMSIIDQLEELIDACNAVIDGEAEEVIFPNKNPSIKTSNHRHAKNIRAMAYALRSAIHNAEEK